ncbi:MAG TPA: hypothetical protein VM869_37480 [Enhygromyxa sp.]|nr:hypothetical protein [Enhygromyxa sp.]
MSSTRSQSTPSAAERLRAAGQGELLEELRLNGEIALASGRSSSTSLCLSNEGLFLVLLRSSDEGVIDLLRADRRLRYHAKTLGDRLEIDHWSLSVPWGRGEQAQRMIGLARIRQAFGPITRDEAAARRELDNPDGPWAWSGLFIDEVDPLARAWLLRWLDADERLLVWRTTDELYEFASAVLGEVSIPRVLVITERRQALVAISPVGDLWTAALPESALEVESSTVGRALVRAGEYHFRVALGDERSFTELAGLPGLRGVERLRELARVTWLRDHTGAIAERAAAMLEELAPGDPFARLAQVLLVDAHLKSLERPAAEDASREHLAPAPLPDPILAALRELVEHSAEDVGAKLVQWWRAWELGPELGELLVEHLCELDTAGLTIALPLHEQLHPILQAKLEDDPEDAALLDFVLTEHLLALGQAERALELLRVRRGQLPSEQLQDLLPPSPGRGGQRIRIELYELAAEAHEQLDDGHVEALAELARLQPLAAERVDQLIARLRARLAEPGNYDDEDEQKRHRSLLRRAERARALFEESGFASPLALAQTDVEPEPEPGTALARRKARILDTQKLELLRHPAARVDGVLGRLQGALAKVAVPDCSVLKSYCERANLARDTALAGALTDATMVLGLGGVEVYVSRGEKSVGMRAYEGGTSFLLIGGDHLNPNSDAYLDESALRFAVAAELAHLRYAHSRVTSDEVWAGTFDLGLTGLGMLIAAAPILTKLKAPAKHLLDKVGAPAIDRWRKKLSKRDAHSLVSDNSQLIAAHRAMQLSADRAGLLVCGDPRAAIRAMFAVNPAYLSSWPLVVSHGLRAAITRELRDDDPRERERLEDLAVRTAALLSFYLSDEYAQLRAAGFERAQKS